MIAWHDCEWRGAKFYVQPSVKLGARFALFVFLIMLLTCFDVLFFEMYFASVNPVVVYLWSKIFVNDACLRELTQPLRSPGLVFFVLSCWKFKNTDSIRSSRRPATKYSTVIARHFEKIEAEIRKLDLFTSNTNDSIVRLRLWYEVVHGHDHVTCQKWEQ